MKPELQDQEVLAMYDVRGIQSYIFKSNAAERNRRSICTGGEDHHRRSSGLHKNSQST